MSTLPAQIDSRTIVAYGRRIHLLEAGEGPMVLFCHGFPELGYAWRHQVQGLADAGYHAVAIDMLGYGRSAKPTSGDTRITVQVETFVDIVKQLGHTSAVIVGHDMGAPRAWSAAWTRPDVFHAVVGVSIPFAGRGSMAWPGDSFGELRPSEIERQVAGPGNIHYQKYFAQPGALAAEAEADLRGWLNALYYGTSARNAGLPSYGDLGDWREAQEFLRQTAIVLRPGEGFSDKLPTPGDNHWIAQEELDTYASAYESTGLESPLNLYRTLDLDWELLAPWAGKPLEVPALYIAGEHDLCALWAIDAIQRMREVAPHAHDPVILDGLGHWNFQEGPEVFNAALLSFLSEIDPVEA